MAFLPPSGMVELSFTARVERPPSFLMIPPNSLAFPLGKDAHVGRSAAVERGPSQGARSGSTGPMWAFFLLHSSEAARCVSTKDAQPSRSHRLSTCPVPRSLGSVPGCGRGADARLRPYLLCQKAATVLCRLAASVKDREQPDAHESDRHREQRRRGIREQRAAFRIAQGRFPHRRRQDREQHR